MDTINLKKNLRKDISHRKNTIPFDKKCLFSNTILNKLEQLDNFSSAHTILIYHALPDEVQTVDFLNKWYINKRIVLPLVKPNFQLILKEYNPKNIQVGYKNIPEPTSDATTINAEDIDLAVIPGVGFDSKCNRMGRGKGFYDRLIPRLNCPLIGLAYDLQIVDDIPVDKFDKKMDKVLTEKREFIKKVLKKK
ncbi:MAG: 5-formyltetrahydrofolate cyclo-ligase [Bacteroidales bacterium]